MADHESTIGKENSVNLHPLVIQTGYIETN